MVQRVQEGSLSWNIFISIVVTIMGFLGILMVTAVFATLIGWTIRIGLATPVHRRIDTTLEQITILLKTAKEQGTYDSQRTDKLLSEAESLQKAWNESISTKVVNRLLKLGAKTKNKTKKKV